MKPILLVLACIACNAAAQVFMRKGAVGAGQLVVQDATSVAGWMGMLTSLPVVAGLLLWTVSTLIWLYVLAQVPLSYAYALYGLNFIVTPLAASVALAEPLPWIRIAGMSLTAAGVALTVCGGSAEAAP